MSAEGGVATNEISFQLVYQIDRVNEIESYF